MSASNIINITFVLTLGAATANNNVDPSVYYTKYTGHADITKKLAAHSDMYQLVDIYKRDYECFTQGFFVEPTDHTFFVESCGWYQKSRALTSALVGDKLVQQQSVKFNSRYFGEGIALLNSTHYVALTWQDKKFIIIEKEGLKITKEINFPSEIKEGWGLTHSQDKLYLTDGSSHIFILDPSTLKVEKKLQVKNRAGKALSNLNEIEYFKDDLTGKEYIWSNIFLSNDILLIDLATG